MTNIDDMENAIRELVTLADDRYHGPAIKMLVAFMNDWPLPAGILEEMIVIIGGRNLDAKDVYDAMVSTGDDANE